MISIVIPVHNEEENLPQLYERLSEAARAWDEDYEVIVVDDCSTDGSPELLAKFHVEDPRWKSLRFSRNFGHQTAVSAGVYYSRGDAVVVIDGDLQDPPEVIVELLERWREGYQVVYAVRRQRKENVFKVAAYGLFYRMLRRLASIEIPLDSGDFCLMDRRVVDVLKAMPERSRFVRGLRSWAGFRQIGFEYQRHARHGGKSKYSLLKLMQLAANGMISFSSSPLRLASFLGGMLCVLSVLLVVLLVAWRLADVTILGMNPRGSVGWTSIVSLNLLLFGMLMMLMGIIGEYLACLFEEVKGRPPWIIAQAQGFRRDAHENDPGWFAGGPSTHTTAEDRRDAASSR